MLEQTIAAITHLDAAIMNKCQVRLDNLTKPLNSLLYFERLARQLAGITGDVKPGKNLKKSILLLTDCTESAAQRLAIETGTAPICQFSKHIEAPVVLKEISIEDHRADDAMTREDVLYCLTLGIQAARAEAQKGVRIIGLDALDAASEKAGTALIAWCDASKATKKDQPQATKLSSFDPKKADPLTLLEKLNSPALAGLTGALLGAAASKAAIVLDGIAADAAAYLAAKLAPPVKEYLIGSHLSAAPLHREALDLIGMPVHLNLHLSIGQGIGAAMSMILVNASLYVLNDMKTFGEAGVAVAQDGPGACKQRPEVRD